MSQPTAPQLDYVDGLKRKLKLSTELLDAHCVAKFGCRFREIDKRLCSELLEEMKPWSAIPVELKREAGQNDLPGFGS